MYEEPETALKDLQLGFFITKNKTAKLQTWEPTVTRLRRWGTKR